MLRARTYFNSLISKVSKSRLCSDVSAAVTSVASGKLTMYYLVNVNLVNKSS